jgi:hypothetical protein
MAKWLGPIEKPMGTAGSAWSAEKDEAGYIITDRLIYQSLSARNLMSSKPDSDPSNPPSNHRSPGPLSMILSVLAAFFGVQSEKNRERDFQHGRPIHFILIGLIMTLLFILAVLIAVKLALRSAGV